MKKTKSYTLAEVLIAMTVVGIIAAVSIPTITKLIPDKNTAMIRKAYYVVDNIVQELINDKYYYPDATGNCYDYIEDVGDATTPAQMVGLSSVNGCYYGFDNRVAVKIHGTDRVVEGDEKFIALFVSKLNTKKDFEEILWDDDGTFKLGDFSSGSGNNTLDIETEDGMVFHFEWRKYDTHGDHSVGGSHVYQTAVDDGVEGALACPLNATQDHFRWCPYSRTYGMDNDSTDPAYWHEAKYNIVENELLIDINGKKAPNRYEIGPAGNENNRCRGDNWGTTSCNDKLNRNVKGFDSIKLIITRDGKVKIPDTWTELAKILDNSKNMTK